METGGQLWKRVLPVMETDVANYGNGCWQLWKRVLPIMETGVASYGNGCCQLWKRSGSRWGCTAYNGCGRLPRGVATAIAPSCKDPVVGAIGGQKKTRRARPPSSGAKAGRHRGRGETSSWPLALAGEFGTKSSSSSLLLLLPRPSSSSPSSSSSRVGRRRRRRSRSRSHP